MKKSDAWADVESRITTCRFCPRLVVWREAVAQTKRRAYQHEDYWGRPVPGFGDQAARVLIVGLAPAAHGANRTGRMFTGDSSGDFLYGALYGAGFANQPTSRGLGDGLALRDVFISAVCRCAPPDNKPTAAEIANCLPYLNQEMALLERLHVIVALGRIAFEGALHVLQGHKTGFAITVPSDDHAKPVFADAAVYRLATAAAPGEPVGPQWLVTSYHPSRQNTQTGRLTLPMFDEVWAKVLHRLDTAAA